MAKEIFELDEISFGKKYRIEVADPQSFTGAFDEDQSVYENAQPESRSGSNVEFLVNSDGTDEFGDEFDAYEDIPDENIVSVFQDDLNEKRVRIFEQ